MAFLQLLTQYWTNSTVREYVDRIDWYFLPVANPDGYEYTHTTVSVVSQGIHRMGS